MKSRAVLAVAVLCLLLTGCVQSEQVYTLNPDGIRQGGHHAGYPVQRLRGDGRRAGGRGKKPSLEDQKRAFLNGLLAKSPGVDTWKDISAEFTPDGRLKFRGTAYFKDVSKFKLESAAGSAVKLLRRPDGSLRLVFDAEQTRPDLGGGKDKDEPPDPQKATDKELDDYILSQKVAYQSMKGLLTAMLTDLRIKSVFHLPGDVSEVNVYRGEGKRAVSIEVEGDRLLKAINGMFAHDNAYFRKRLRAGDQVGLAGDAIKLFKELGLDWNAANATVARPTGPQFDYAKEAGAARAAYPALRKRLGLSEEKKDPFSPELKSP